MRYSIRLPLSAVLVTCLMFSSLFAIGSEEKTPEEKASDNAKKSVEAYNNAVKRIERAKEIGEKGNPSYTFDYRATPEQKARQEYEKAVKDLQKAVKLNPAFKEAHNNMGYCYRKLGKLDESLAAYDKAITLDSNFFQAREYRGETYLALDRLSDAEKEMSFLMTAKSEYAAQLAKSIEFYKQQQSEKTSKAPGQ